MSVPDPSEDAKLEELRRRRDWAAAFALLTERAMTGPMAERPKSWNDAATLMRDRFANEAETIRCWTASLALDPAQPQIVASLRALLTKRRDYDGLRAIANSPSERAAVDDLQRAKRSWWRRLFGAG